MVDERITKQLNRLMMEMKAADRREEHGKARGLAFRLLAVDPDYPDAMELLMDALDEAAKTSNWHEVQNLASRVLELNPNLDAAQSFLAMASVEAPAKQYVPKSDSGLAVRRGGAKPFFKDSRFSLLV
jgi:hypothetical protein